MRIQLYLLALSISLVACNNGNNTASTTESKADPLAMDIPAYALVIHGGAGYQRPDNHDSTKQAIIKRSLNAALDVGQKILAQGGTSLDAVEQVIRLMEDDTLFNSGRGAVFTHEGRNEHDASIMSGADLNAGATGGTTIVKHPISAARAVMEKSNHVMLSGPGAEIFAKEQGLEIVDPSYFYTTSRYNRMLAARGDDKHGTVGCVALDKDGNIAAGTSTGGMTNKRWNRIGDSPIIGAGTYASNASCGVSSTGHGEYFIRYTVARDIAARMELAGETLDQAANHVINKTLVDAGGSGGIVALDHQGNISMTFNTPGMYRGFVKPNEREVSIFKD